MLIDKAALVSAAQRSDSVIHIYIRSDFINGRKRKWTFQQCCLVQAQP